MVSLNAPIFLKKRFSSIKGLAWQYLYPEDERRETLRKLKTRDERKEKYSKMREEVEELSQLLFLFGMYKFFNEGTQAAIKAVDIFKKIDMPGFTVGNDLFEERNETVMRGEKLAEAMLEAINNQNIVIMIRESEYMYQIVDKFKKIKNA